MPVTCLNCGNVFEGKFCPNCGQKASMRRLTFSLLVEEFVHIFTHIEHGFLFTSWRFFAHPGQSSIAYISGKRNAYQKPVSYFLIWTGLYILTHNAIIHYHHLQLTTQTIAELNIREQSNLLFRQHFTLFILPVILLSGWLLYLILGRPKYNFIEILTLSLYGGGTYFMMSWISDIVLGMIVQINILSLQVFFWQMIMSSAYNLWFSFDFFKRSPVRFLWIRLILASLSIAFGGWVIMFYLPMLWLKIFYG